jgi:formylglycine-generating enzyme required for sulfatase activity
MRTLNLLRTLALAATLPVLLTACGGTGDDDDTNAAFDTTVGTTGQGQPCRRDDDCPLPLFCIDLACQSRPAADTDGTDTSSTGPGGNVTDGGDDDTTTTTTTTTGGNSGDDGTGTETDDATTTTGPVGDCRSDADCFFPTPICLRASGLCVECLSAADCDAGESCIDNACSFGTETDGTDGSETTGNTDIGCPAEKDCRGLECGADPVCGLSCGTCKSGYICQFGSCVVSDNAVCPADKDCTGRVCGLDPVCGTSCGTCDSGSYCFAGQCKQGSPKCPQETNCDGRECGTDPNCGASCGSCGAIPPDRCVNSSTLWQFKGGGFCNTSAQCQYNNYTEKNCPYGCLDGACQPCKPSCSGKVCGDDGCGGTCGSCNSPPANVCQSATTLRKYSGASSCSGSGQCNYTFTDVTCTTGCANGKCQGCEPDCSGRSCGPDPVCGTSCGGCTGTDKCNAAGQCESDDGMVLVPSGAFRRGCNSVVDSECSSDESPYKTITLSAFKIDKTEVTVSAYKACVNAGECSAPNTGNSCNWNVSGREDHPINCVDWAQANAYCAWAGKRLPTEAEWEKAARGTDGRKYPWGNQAIDCTKANYSGCVGSTTSVGDYPSGASPDGALDMGGNVWEWVTDWYDSGYYATSPTTDPEGPSSGQYRVLRGGSWSRLPADARASNRLRDSPGFRFEDLGFRCAQ